MKCAYCGNNMGDDLVESDVMFHRLNCIAVESISFDGIGNIINIAYRKYDEYRTFIEFASSEIYNNLTWDTK